MIAMLLGCISEIMGYAGRIMYSQNPWGNTGFIMQIGKVSCRHSFQTTLILVVTITFAPVFFAGAIYVLISKMWVAREGCMNRADSY